MDHSLRMCMRLALPALMFGLFFQAAGQSSPPDCNIALSATETELSWVSGGGDAVVYFSNNAQGPFVSLDTLFGIAPSQQASYGVDTCGYYSIAETSGGCSEVVNNFYWDNEPESLRLKVEFVGDNNRTAMRIYANATPQHLSADYPVLVRVWENDGATSKLLYRETVPMSRLKFPGIYHAVYKPCVQYKVVARIFDGCTIYTRTIRPWVPVSQAIFARLGRKQAVGIDAIDLRWSTLDSLVIASGVSVDTCRVLVARVGQGGTIANNTVETEVQTITDPTQLLLREVRVTSAQLRAAGLLGTSQSLGDVSLRFRISTHTTGNCAPAYSNAHYEYACSQFTLFTSCASCPASVAARIRVLEQPIPSDETEQVGAYPNPSNGHFMLSVPQSWLDAGPVRVSVSNAAGHTVLEGTLGDASLERFDFSSQPAGLYLIRVMGAGQSQTLKIVKE
jgi:hypothetical protein